MNLLWPGIWMKMYGRISQEEPVFPSQPLTASPVIPNILPSLPHYLIEETPLTGGSKVISLNGLSDLGVLSYLTILRLAEKQQGMWWAGAPAGLGVHWQGFSFVCGTTYGGPQRAWSHWPAGPLSLFLSSRHIR